MKTTSIMIVGVGGQGTLLASKLLGNVLLRQGFDVKLGRGAACRSAAVRSPPSALAKGLLLLVDLGEADYILSFELPEICALDFASQRTDSWSPTRTRRRCPSSPARRNIRGTSLKSSRANVIALDALPLAEQAGSARAVNVVLIGVLSGLMPFDESVWREAIAETVPKKFLEVNLRAFELGRSAHGR